MLKAKASSLVQFPKCQLAATHAAFEDVEFLEWRMIGDYLCRVSGSSQWWIGDWLVAGAQRFVPAEPENKSGESIEQKQERKEAHKRYAHAVEATGYNVQTLRIFVYVARGIPSLRRRNDISWAHHREVLVLGSELEQDRFLAQAAKNKWAVPQLRQAIRAHMAGKPPAPSSNGSTALDFVPGRWANQFTKWISVQVKDTPITKWSKARRLALRRELRPIVDVYEALEAATPGKESFKAHSTNR